MHRSRSRFVVGCGSVCVDLFYNVSHFPKRGGKGFLSRTHSTPVVSPGGVAFNALAWASLFRAPTALLGHLPRAESSAEADLLWDAFGRHRISDQFVRADAARLPRSLVFADAEERTIIMDSASTGNLTPALITRNWEHALRNSSVVFTEVSQVPLDAVAEVLQTSAEAKSISAPSGTCETSVAEAESIPCSEHTSPISFLDFDIDMPATEAAGLGSPHDARRVLELADVVKTSAHVARSLLKHLFASTALEKSCHPQPPAELCARELQAALGCSAMVLVTDGARGSAACIPSQSSHSSQQPRMAAVQARSGETTNVDTTGAGDAFSGAVLAWLHRNGRTPSEDGDELPKMLRAASAAGYACSRVLASAVPRVGAGEHADRVQLYRAELSAMDADLASLLLQVPSDDDDLNLTAGVL